MQTITIIITATNSHKPSSTDIHNHTIIRNTTHNRARDGDGWRKLSSIAHCTNNVHPTTSLCYLKTLSITAPLTLIAVTELSVLNMVPNPTIGTTTTIWCHNYKNKSHPQACHCRQPQSHPQQHISRTLAAHTATITAIHNHNHNAQPEQGAARVRDNSATLPSVHVMHVQRRLPVI